jgi:hypothetical protein
MFYIISSRIPLISSDFTKRKYFKVFVFGSVFYVLLHYFLNKQVRAGIPEKMRKFLFYIMGVDFAIACILLKYMKTAVPDDEADDDNDDHSHNDNNHKPLQQPQLTKELEEQRRLFLEEHQRRLLHEKMMEQKALEQRAAEQMMLEQKAAEQKAIEQKKSKEAEKTEKTETEDEPTPKQKTPTKKDVVKKELTDDKNAVKNNKTENESELNTESELPIYDK